MISVGSFLMDLFVLNLTLCREKLTNAHAIASVVYEVLNAVTQATGHQVIFFSKSVHDQEHSEYC